MEGLPRCVWIRDQAPCCPLVAWLFGRCRFYCARAVGVGLVVDAAVLAGVGEVVAVAVLVLHRILGVVRAEIGPTVAPGARGVGDVVGVAIIAGVDHVLGVVIGAVSYTHLRAHE